MALVVECPESTLLTWRRITLTHVLPESLLSDVKDDNSTVEDSLLQYVMICLEGVRSLSEIPRKASWLDEKLPGQTDDEIWDLQRDH